MQDQARRQELAAFLRSRRARLSPEDVGLPRGDRRRTPGLRREEVAELAGLGIAWYTWLEQGRKITVSDSVLLAIARALQLNEDEREHLFSVSRRHAVSAADSSDSSAGVSVRDQALLDALDPYPAYIRDDRWNLIAFNRSFGLSTKFSEVPVEERNMLWLLFMHPNPRRLQADWESDARFGVAQFRFEAARFLDEPDVVDLIERLRSRSAEFRELWARHDVVSGVGSRTAWTHDTAGHLEFERCTLSVGPHGTSPLAGVARHMNVLMAMPGTDTEKQLTRLAASVA